MHTETQPGRLWTSGGRWRCVGSKNRQTTPTTTSITSVRQLLGTAYAQMASAATSTALAHQPLGSANGNDTSRSAGRSGRQSAATRRNMRREERVTVQGPVKKQQPDGMSHRGMRGQTADAVLHLKSSTSHIRISETKIWCIPRGSKPCTPNPIHRVGVLGAGDHPDQTSLDAHCPSGQHSANSEIVPQLWTCRWFRSLSCIATQLVRRRQYCPAAASVSPTFNSVRDPTVAGTRCPRVYFV